MKLTTTTLLAGFVLAACSLGPVRVAEAGPSGRSAKMAARLKKYPTSNWLAHYLPDDRYKIAGGVWKYVSTDLDTYYHRPDSPLMLRQSAGRVIGFASAAEAEEAGYKPAPGAVGFGSFGGGAAALSPGGLMVLGDGISRITLPRGWSKAAGMKENIQGITMTMDPFTGPGGQGVAVITLTFPAAAGVDISQFINVQNIKGGMRNMGMFGNWAQSSAVNRNPAATRLFTQTMNSTKVSAVKLNGRSGVLTVTKDPTGKMPTLRQYVFGSGNKMTMIMDMTKGGAGTSIIKTLRMR